MQEMLVESLLRLIRPLRLEGKLALLNRLAAQVEETYATTRPGTPLDQLDRLAGAWADTSDALADEILAARSQGERNLDWD